MRLLVTGATGMLGQAVVGVADRLGHDVTALARDQLDVTDLEHVRRVVGALEPAAVVNCAAWTDVDGAETNEVGATLVNGDGAGNVALAAADAGARIVHVSTDYVFAGDAERPYVEDDPVDPRSAYGRSKLAGEQAVQAANPDHAIVRTAWLFGVGGRNFVDTMLTLGTRAVAGDAPAEVTVVADQVGSPTWTGHLAPVLLELAERRDTGVFHAAGSGRCSWYELTVEAFDQAGVACRVRPTTTDAFPRPARRPAFSALASERPETPTLPAWRDGVAAYLSDRSVVVG